MRLSILKEQKALVEDRRETACATLREVRAAEYRALLDTQKEARHQLGRRQEMGERSPRLLDAAYPVDAAASLRQAPSDHIPRGGMCDMLDRFGIRRGRPVPGSVNGKTPRQDNRVEMPPDKRQRMRVSIAPTAFEGNGPLIASALPAIRAANPTPITAQLRSNMEAVGVHPATPQPEDALTRFGIKCGAARPNAARDLPQPAKANHGDRRGAPERGSLDPSRSEREGSGLRSPRSEPRSAPVVAR